MTKLPAAPRKASVAASRLRKAAPWAVGESMISAGATLASTLLVARLLQPSDFGLAALALTLPALVIALVISPITQSLIRSGRVDTRSNDAIFSMMLILGVASVAACALCGLAMARIYAAPALLMLTTAAGIDCLFAAVAAVPSAILTRKLRTRTLALRTLWVRMASVSVTITLAVLGVGAWAIIGGMLAGSVASCVLLWSSQPRRPRLRHPTGLRELLSMGLWISAEQGLGAITVRGFVLIFGHYHGLAALGYLNFAIRLVDEAGNLIASSIGNVALAFFSAGARAGSDLAGLFVRGTHGVMLIAAPMFFGLAAVSPDLVPAVFSAKWVPSVLAIQLLCLFWTVRMSRALAPALLRAVGIQKALTFNALLAMVATGIALYFTRNAPLAIAVVAYGVRTLVTVPVGLSQIARATGVSAARQVGATLLPLACAVAMASAVLLFRQATMNTLAIVPRLALEVIVGAIAYVTLILLFDRSQLRLILGWWKTR